MRRTAIIFVGALVLPFVNYAAAQMLDVVFAGIEDKIDLDCSAWTLILTAFAIYALIAFFVAKWVGDATSSHK